MQYGDPTISCNHCWHVHRGPLLLVVRDGHVPMSCCKCGAIQTMHADHIPSIGSTREPGAR